MFQTFPKTRLLNLPIGLILFSNIIALFTAVTSAYKSAVFRRDPMSFFANAVISFSLTFVTAYTRWLFSPRALRCRKVPEGERIVSAARNCVILYCTLGLGFLVNTILGKIDRTFYVFIFDADWIRSMFSQQCSGTLHFQCCKWTFRFSEKNYVFYFVYPLFNQFCYQAFLFSWSASRREKPKGCSRRSLQRQNLLLTLHRERGEIF